MEQTLHAVDYQKNFVDGYSEYEKAVEALQSILNTPNILVLAVDSH